MREQKVSPIERGYQLARDNPRLLDELACNLFRSYHDGDERRDSLGRTIRRRHNATAAWSAIGEAGREAWRREVCLAFEEEVVAGITGADLPPDEREHDTDSPDCWCGPLYFTPCEEHADDAEDERCWKCEPSGLIRADRTADQLIVVHRPRTPEPK